jgi:hypothetical protein
MDLQTIQSKIYEIRGYVITNCDNIALENFTGNRSNSYCVRIGYLDVANCDIKKKQKINK